MIDTIGFEIPVGEVVYNKIFNASIGKMGINMASKQVLYKFFHTKITVGSFSRDMNIEVKDNEDKPEWEKYKIYIEFSVPKMRFGHNVDLISLEDFYSEIGVIHKILSEEYGEFPSYKNVWKVKRLDLCWIWKLASQEEATQFIEVLKLLKYYSKSQKHNYNTAVSFVCDDYTNKFYLKNPEYKKHDFKALNDGGYQKLANEVLERSKGVLRYEITIRSGKIKQLFGDLTLDKLKNYDLKAIMRIFLNKVIKMDTTTTGAYDASLILIKEYGAKKGRILYQFWSAYYSENEIDRKVILDNYSRTQIYRNLKDIKKAGVGIKYSKNIDLQIPEDKTP